MSLSEAQLQIWSGHGPVASAKATHEEVRKALANDANLQSVDFEVYLQGSYRNDTNIRGDSDVDVVVELRSTFYSETSALSLNDKSNYDRAFSPAPYGIDAIRADVHQALARHFGAGAVTNGDKALKVAASSGRLPADVLPCAQWRNYVAFPTFGSPSWVEGVVFWTQRDTRRVVNYPKVHYQNGVSKNSAWRTNGEFKPNVRVLKNARSHLENRGVIAPDLAPSYFVESLAYNAPDAVFTASRTASLIGFLLWFDKADLSRLVAQNEQTFLFGPTPEQWSMDSARRFASAVVGLVTETAYA
jgi:hypothetical protein